MADPAFISDFLGTLRDHLRITGFDDDALLTIYSDAAWDFIAQLTGTAAADAPSPVYAAALLLTADLYEHRTAQVEDALYENKAAQMLIYPFRVWA